ncbi:MAG TPA: 6-pyruvoyl-tetrahydropterin synthase-related protein, partial [Vicinamibacteria bacterium]|nr:6-pyruvoyl-tetrahydropterin synthase-related protein [Vicinamibacteria bacterium]
FLDPWVSEWALGYPVWRSYQPLPHLFAAAVMRLAEPWSGHAASFAFLQYALLVLWPASVYAGARLMGFEPAGAGLASLLVLAPSATGELGRYGLGLGAFVWRGSGLYTQLVALHFLVLSLGATVRALDRGRGRVLAALLLGLTILSHIVFGYVALLSALVLALASDRDARARATVRLATIAALALLLVGWFVVPLWQAVEAVNHSRWEAAHKWDSFGAPAILRELASGRLLDAGRGPWLSLCVLGGAVVAAWRWRDMHARRLLALAVVWLALFFGRATWGHLLRLAAVPADLPLHRLQAAFELSAVLLAAWGLHVAISRALTARRLAGMGLAALAVLAVAACLRERVSYLREGTVWGDQNLAARGRSRGDVDAALADVRALLAPRPGRVSAGLAAGWGGAFKIGATPVYALLTEAHLDQASFLFHSMSSASDLMPLRDENDPAHAAAFGVRAVIAPAERPMPAWLRRRATHGPLAVYEASDEGYFGLVDVGARYVGPRSTFYEPSASWLQSPLLRADTVVALGGEADQRLPVLVRWQPLPAPDPAVQTPCGRIVSEAKEDETYSSRVALARPCHVLVKLSWHPDLVATVDGAPAPLLRVTPGFGAVPVPTGEHEVVVAYRPGPLKAALFLAGLVLFAAAARALRGPAARRVEEDWSARLAAAGARASTARAGAAWALAVLSVLALRPLFRGRLIGGHDATEYPPRLVEFARAVADGHLPAVWAADLGAGHGQPLFAFAPPLLYAVAWPMHALGARLADSLQVALALLHVAGAVAVYRIGRREFSRPAAIGGAAAWLFAPYTALDLYVRSAFAEATAVAVAPLAVLGLLRAVDRPSARRAGMAAVALALIPLAHNAAALLLYPSLLLLGLLAASRASRRREAVLAVGAALLLGLGLSAFFWLPALLEKGFVQTDLLRQDFLRWSEHTVTFGQLLWSRWGYGLSVPGRGDQMSFAVGPVHLLLAAAGTLLAVRGPDRQTRRVAIALAAVALTGAWLATSWASALWARVETLQYLAYPWRALILPGLCLPLLALPAFARLGSWAAAVVAVVVVFNLGHTEPREYVTFDDE